VLTPLPTVERRGALVRVHTDSREETMTLSAIDRLSATRDETARRVAIQNAIGQAVDDLLRGDDMRGHHDEHERLAHLTEAVGEVASDLLRNRTLDLDACLSRVAAEAVAWLEARARDAAL